MKRANPYAANQRAAMKRRKSSMNPPPKRFYPRPLIKANRPLRLGGYANNSQSETKFVDVATASYNLVSSSANVTLLNTIAQGASQSQRIGRKVMLKSVWIKGRMSSGTTTTIAGWRWAIVYDRQSNKAAPVFNDIFDTTGFDTMKRDDNKDRFIILSDNIGQNIGNTTTPATGQEQCIINTYVKLNLVQEFASVGTGAIGDIVAGALFLVSCSNLTAGTTNPIMTFTARTRYVDYS